MPSPAPPGVIATPLLESRASPGAALATGLTGAAAAGMAVAVWITHPEGQPWEVVEVGTLGAGIGAAIGYGVKWIDIARRWLERKLEPADAPERPA